VKISEQVLECLENTGIYKVSQQNGMFLLSPNHGQIRLSGKIGGKSIRVIVSRDETQFITDLDKALTNVD